MEKMKAVNPEYSISKKKIDLLYETIHRDIMNVRLKLCGLSDKELSNQLNEIMAELCYEAPKKAIDLFRKKPTTS